jgi:hypothetical protein
LTRIYTPYYNYLHLFGTRIAHLIAYSKLLVYELMESLPTFRIPN